jgi:exosortase/archaeosortase family protein
MNTFALGRTALWVRLAAWIDTCCPAALWIVLTAVALWPSAQWMLARMTDGSDDPLGLAAIAVVLLVLWQDRNAMRITPVWLRLGAALVGVLATVVFANMLPPLLIALIAALAMLAVVAAFAPVHRPLLPLAGLWVLAVPVISSLQFYAGFPLRVFTAQASTVLFNSMGYTAHRAGSAMWVQGQLIVVDAPCSGVQMVWLAYFTACTVAVLCRLNTRRFLLRLPLVGITVLAGNVVRNTVLVMGEVAAHGWPAWAHQAVGLGVLALVCGAVGVLMGWRARA